MKPFVFTLSMAVLVVTAWRPPAAAAWPQTVQPAATLTVIADTAIRESHAYADLEELSDTIGGRVTGSAADAIAAKWALNRMQTVGLTRPHLESWSLKRGWTRGRASAEIIAPVRRPLTVASMGWVGSTRSGGEEALLLTVDRNTLDRQDPNTELRWAGHILLLRSLGASRDSFSVFSQLASFVRRARRAGAVAVLGQMSTGISTGSKLTHVEPVGFSDEYYDLPVLSIAAEDQRLLERLLDRGSSILMRVDVRNHVTSGPVLSANVVGEIPGTEHPDEIVVIGAHLDSWDLSESASDDGAGVVTVLGAADAIIRSGVRPRRTIRIVLFTGEEEGLLGSRAYVQAHQVEMPNHVAALVQDEGEGPIVRLELSGRADLIDQVQGVVPTTERFGPLTVNDSFYLFTDAFSFTLAGVPGINLGQNSPNAAVLHHSAADTLDKVDSAVLTRNAALVAVVSYWFADRPERLGRIWSPDETARMLTQKRFTPFLKGIGLWPFPD
jgi:carboxypeptidase Q